MWSKLFDFSGNTIAKILSLIFKIMIIIGVPALVLWGVYVLAIKPHTNPTPTTSQKADAITNYSYYFYPNKKVFGLGLNVFGLDVGFVKYDYPTKPTTVVKETTIKGK